MGLRINTNVPSISAQRTLGQTTQKLQNVLGQLSSGTRIVSAADDAAGLAISEKLKSSIRSGDQANRNANDGISLIQTAEGGLNEVSSILIRLRELSVQAASDTVGNDERAFSDMEFQSLKDEIERISAATEFNGRKLLNGSGDRLDFQIGINNGPEEDRVSFDPAAINSGLDGLDIGGLNVKSKEDSQESLASLDSALKTVSGQRSMLGALQNRLQSTSRGLEVMSENLSAANSRIRDTDFAQASANNTKLNILAQAGTSVLAQANASSSGALRLLG